MSVVLNKEKGTLVHMLWDCPTTRELQKEVDMRVQMLLNFSSQTSPGTYILGHVLAGLGFTLPQRLVS